ncbi:hypothetical protein E2I00_012160, partial [Balaenoptera physalus]
MYWAFLLFLPSGPLGRGCQEQAQATDWRSTLQANRKGVHKIDKCLNAVLDLLGGEDWLCQCKCSAGSKPFPRCDEKPSPPKGCGSSPFGVHLNIGIPSLTKCCKQRDRGYGTCGKSKKDCEEEYQCCPSKICRDLRKTLGPAQHVGPREELRTAERGILCATGVDWESQLRPKESTPLQDILEENSSHDLQMGLGLDLRMQIKPMMGERGTPLTPGDRSALQESPWSSEDTGLKVAVQIQRVATSEPAPRLLNLLGAGGSAVPAQDPAWLREESTEEEAVAPGTLNICLQ